MATETKDFRLRAVADIADLRAELAKIPGITEKEAKAAATKMVTEFGRAQRATQKAAAAQAKAFAVVPQQAFDKASGSVTNYSRAATKANTITNALASSLGAVSPQLGAAVGAAGDAARGLDAVVKSGSTLAPALGILTAAVGVGALAWRHYEDELKAAEQRMNDASAAATRMQTAVTDLAASEARAELELRSALGESGAADELALFDARAKAAATYGATRKEINDRLLADSKRLVEAERELQTLESGPQSFDLVIAAQAKAKSVDQLRASVEAQRGQIDALASKEEHYAQVIVGTAEAEKITSTAVRERTSALKDANTESAEAAAKAQELSAALADVAEDVARANDPATWDMQKQISDLATLRAEALAAGESIETIDERIQQLNENIAGENLAAETKAIEEIAKAKKDADDNADADAKALREQQLKNNEAALDGIDQMLGATSDLFALSQQNADLTAEQLRKRAAAEKTFAISQVAINAAVAIIKALAQLGPIAGPIAVGGITATAAAQTATIAAQPIPQFHRGGGIDSRTMAPDERLARVTKSEKIVPRGSTTESAHVTVINRWGHRVFDSFVRDDIRRNGSLAKSIRGRDRVGHSSRR